MRVRQDPLRRDHFRLLKIPRVDLVHLVFRFDIVRIDVGCCNEDDGCDGSQAPRSGILAEGDVRSVDRLGVDQRGVGFEVVLKAAVESCDVYGEDDGRRARPAEQAGDRARRGARGESAVGRQRAQRL